VLVDPLTTTAVALKLGLGTVKIIKDLNQLKSKWKNALVTLLALHSECEAMSFTLVQVHEMLSQSPHLAKYFKVPEDSASQSLPTVLASCQITFRVLREKVEAYLNAGRTNEFGEVNMGRSNLVWKDNGIDSAGRNVSRLVGVLNLILTGLNLLVPPLPVRRIWEQLMFKL
jgi:hypothetical protein